MSNSLLPYGLQQPGLPCPSLSPEVCSNSRPFSWWCHPILSSLLPASSHALRPSQQKALFQGVGSSHQVAKVLEFQLQHQCFQWIFKVDFPLGFTGLISLLSKGLSRVFYNTVIQKHQFFGAQPSFDPALSSVHDYWKTHNFDSMDLCWWCLCFLICCLDLA